MNNAIFFACYLPSRDKIYVLEEIFEYFYKDQNADVYIGIQYGSISETESIIKKLFKNKNKLYIGTVTKKMMIDSDASSFLKTLELYKKQSNKKAYKYCYFLHSKSITSGNDELRTALLKELFLYNFSEIIDQDFIGSYGPILTVTDVEKDIELMKCMKKFISDDNASYDVMEYYYLNTFYVVKGHIIKTFIDTVKNNFFDTHIKFYSDRYFFERDFYHICDMYGYLPSYKYLGGNYSTNYKTPTKEDVDLKLNKYLEKRKAMNERN